VKEGRRRLERKKGGDGTREDRILWEKEVETRWMIVKEGRRRIGEKGRRGWYERGQNPSGEGS